MGQAIDDPRPRLPAKDERTLLCSPVVYPGVRQSASAPGGRGDAMRAGVVCVSGTCLDRTSAVSVGRPTVWEEEALVSGCGRYATAFQRLSTSPAPGLGSGGQGGTGHHRGTPGLDKRPAISYDSERRSQAAGAAVPFGRGVAQSGSAQRLGRWGRGFESLRPDHPHRTRAPAIPGYPGPIHWPAGDPTSDCACRS